MGYVDMMVDITIEAGAHGRRWLVLACACGEEESGNADRAERVGAAVIRMVNHAEKCEKNRENESIRRENADQPIDASR